jgi:signal peptidase I
VNDRGAEAVPGPSAEEVAAQPEARPPRRRSRVVDVLAVGGLLVLIAYLHVRVVRVIYVPTGSMAPTIQPGDRLLVHIGAYRKHPPRRGDIVAFWSEDSNEYEVKRVIGVPGDLLVVGAGIVLRNGRRLHEPYIAAPMVRETPVGGYVPPDELFVMGDNRNDSEDSRDFGPIRQDLVMGRVFVRILPLEHAGRVR